MLKLLKTKWFWVLVLILGFITLKTFLNLHSSSTDDTTSKGIVLSNNQLNTVKHVPTTSSEQSLMGTNTSSGEIAQIHNSAPKSLLSPDRKQHSTIEEQSTANKANKLNVISMEQPKEVHVSWDTFASYPYTPTTTRTAPDRHREQEAFSSERHKSIICSKDIIANLSRPRLSDSDFKWCQWALSPSGGKVTVGKSWGKLKTKPEMLRFDLLSCNSVQNGKNPSCDDSWGGVHIRNWLENPVPKSQFSCLEDGKHKSKQTCFRNDNNDVYCELENVMIDFSKFSKVERREKTATKKWSRQFITTDCNDNSAEESTVFPFPYLYSTQLSRRTCDYVHNGTVLLYSHDDIRNLGHTLNDIMNVWVMLWLGRLGRDVSDINLLNIDAFKHGHNFDDQPNRFFLHYEKTFKKILKGHDYKDKTVCFQKLLIQPIPPRFFIWESWFIDMPCSFLGPSSLYQRWNYDIRHRHGLFAPVSSGSDSGSGDISHNSGSDGAGISGNNAGNHNAGGGGGNGSGGEYRGIISLPTDNVFKVLLIIRNEKSNLWGSSRTSRNFLNLPAIQQALQSVISSDIAHRNSIPKLELFVQDLSQLNFEEQIRLISTVSIMIGTHGAGIASSMHMSVGTKYCCGVLEIYPAGEFTPIRGHGNMARKMGLHYDRIDVVAKDSLPDGVTVPIEPLVSKVKGMITQITVKPTCILSEVLKDPFLEWL